MALRPDGSIRTWGCDDHGQTTNAPTGSGYIAIEGGTNYGIALTPEPATLGLVLFGGLALLRRRK